MVHTDDNRALSRRAFVGKISRGAAGTALALSLTPRVSSAGIEQQVSTNDNDRDIPTTGMSETDLLAAEANELGSSELTSSAPAPWNLLRPLKVGDVVADGWQLSGLDGAVGGACVATLQNAMGRAQRLHICRNDGSPRGLVYTDRFDLVVMNGGRGDLPTEESFGRAVAEIAHVIAGNEAAHDELARTLLPQSEREQQFAATARLR